MSADLPSAPVRPNLPFVLLYTTAEEFRPTYRRGILDALAYPAGHTIEYSYRRKNISPIIVEAITGRFFDGVHGAIVFVDVALPQSLTYSPSASPSDAVKYYPLRRVTLRAPDGVLAGIEERARVRLRLTLGDFIAYDPDQRLKQWHTQWHERVEAFDRDRDFHGETPRYFVIRAEDPFGQLKVDERTAWEDVVTAASRSYQLGNCVFVRVPPLRRVKDSGLQRVPLLRRASWATSEVKPSAARDTVEYLLKPDSVYRLELSVFEPRSKDGGQTKIAIKSSSDDILQVDQPFQSMVAGTSEWAVHLATRRNLERDTGAITVEVTSSSGTGVNAPNPVLFVHIPVGWLLVIFFLALVFVGVFLASLDKESIADISRHPALIPIFGAMSNDPAFYAIMAKVIGSAVLAIAAWVGFRKLPSAIRG
jgi:hypothetical protein